MAGRHPVAAAPAASCRFKWNRKRRASPPMAGGAWRPPALQHLLRLVSCVFHVKREPPGTCAGTSRHHVFHVKRVTGQAGPPVMSTADYNSVSRPRTDCADNRRGGPTARAQGRRHTQLGSARQTSRTTGHSTRALDTNADRTRDTPTPRHEHHHQHRHRHQHRHQHQHQHQHQHHHHHGRCSPSCLRAPAWAAPKLHRPPLPCLRGSRSPVAARLGPVALQTTVPSRSSAAQAYPSAYARLPCAPTRARNHRRLAARTLGGQTRARRRVPSQRSNA
jgi:hypothetical protein